VFRSGLVATGLFALYTVPASIGLGLILAVMLNQKLRAISFFRTMMASTIAISAAVGSIIWLLLFNPSVGLLNHVLSLVGIPGPHWLIQPNVAIVSVSITTSQKALDDAVAEMNAQIDKYNKANK